MIEADMTVDCVVEALYLSMDRAICNNSSGIFRASAKSKDVKHFRFN